MHPNSHSRQPTGAIRISEEVSTEEIQSLAGELQILRNQIQTISSQFSEYGMTVEALSKQDPERPVYRSLGNILLEVDDRDSLESELKDAQEALNEHLGRLVEREESIRKRYEQMVIIVRNSFDFTWKHSSKF